MLHKSGINLEKGAIDFIINNESITLFSAYIKINELEKINVYKNIKQIIVRWEIEDLCKGVSDVELYQYCLKNKISLYRNTRLHMKAFWNNGENIVFGSANVTARGLGSAKKYNYELNGQIESISLQDKIYLNNVIASSEYVTEELFHKIKNLIDEFEIPTIPYPELPSNKSETDSFLISQLPMSLSPDDLYEVAINSQEFNDLEINCAAHDIALYEIDPFQDYSLFKSEIKFKFNKHPFIIALKKHINSQESKSLRYGGVVEWIQSKTTTVPTPRSWDIKKEQIVNILYTWICYFDDDYTWDVPGNRSEVIYYNEKYITK
jgi:hypothetical protein